jgi:hypothetical protein
MLRGLSLRHEGPAVLIVDEASRVRDELWATISPMLAAAPAAQQILLSTPAGASGEFHRAWSSNEDWERVQITADQSALGFCFFDSHQLPAAKSLSCVAKHEDGSNKSISRGHGVHDSPFNAPGLAIASCARPAAN